MNGDEERSSGVALCDERPETEAEASGDAAPVDVDEEPSAGPVEDAPGGGGAGGVGGARPGRRRRGAVGGTGGGRARRRRVGSRDAGRGSGRRVVGRFG